MLRLVSCGTVRANGPEYAGSTHASGACRPGSIPGGPNGAKRSEGRSIASARNASGIESRSDVRRARRNVSIKNLGGPDRFRTGYLLIANEALYQLSYGPLISLISIYQAFILESREHLALKDGTQFYSVRNERIYPHDFFYFALWLCNTSPPMHQKYIQLQKLAFLSCRGRIKYSEFLQILQQNLDAEFFIQFPRERFFRCFPRIEFASRTYEKIFPS